MTTVKIRLIAGLATVGLLAGAGAAYAVDGGPVASVPNSGIPQIATSGTDGSVEAIRQIVQCGNTMYAVGNFTQIKRFTMVYNRTNAFAFDATSGVMRPWAPVIADTAGAPVVNSIALSADCNTAYLGGTFSSINGTPARNIAAVTAGATNGEVIAPFTRTDTIGQVSTLLLVNNNTHLLVGGYFSRINGSAAHPYLASLNPSTGLDDGYANLAITGNYAFVDDAAQVSAPNVTRIFNFALSPDKTKLLAMGIFTGVGSPSNRRQMVMLDLGPGALSVNPWYPADFNQNCSVIQPFWLQDAAWAPDGSKIYIATTGVKPSNGAGFNPAGQRAGLCDAAAAFTTSLPATRLWVNYTGCDSLFSVAADSTTVYVGGHERWANNINGCDVPGTGAVFAPGMVGLNAATGALTFNPTRGRGVGATDMLRTDAGLWIASDNAQNTDMCGGEIGHKGLCFLPTTATPTRLLSTTISTPGRIVYPAKTTVSGVVTDAGVPVSGATVTIWAMPRPSETPVLQYTTTTNSSGAYSSVPLWIGANTYYHAVATSPGRSGTSTTTFVPFYPSVNMSSNTASVVRGGTVYMSGNEIPGSLRELPMIEALTPAGWAPLVRAYAVTSTGIWSAKWVVPSTYPKGRLAIRPVLQANIIHYQGTGSARYVTVV